MKALFRELASRWFLVSLLVLIPLGLAIGQRSANVGETIDFVAPVAALIVPFVLFVMSLTLDTKQLLASLTRPWAVLWACCVNALLLPLIAWPVSQWQLMEDFRIGVVIAAAVPSTMAAASVWTRRAGGNDAVSLLTTLLTNGLCFAYTPVVVSLLAGQIVEMDVAAMAWRLVKTALVPACLGQVVRQIVTRFLDLDRLKTGLGVLAQCGILVIVFGASANAGPRLLSLGTSQAAAITVMLVSCLAIHLATAAIAYWGGKQLRFPEGDARACLFAGSQKTLPIGLLIATDPGMLGRAGVPLAVFPMLAFHMLQLFADTMIADRLKQKPALP